MNIRNFSKEQQKLNSDFDTFYESIKSIIKKAGFYTSEQRVINPITKEFYIPIKKTETSLHIYELVYSESKLILMRKKKRSESMQYLDEPRQWISKKRWSDIPSFTKELVSSITN